MTRGTVHAGHLDFAIGIGYDLYRARIAASGDLPQEAEAQIKEIAALAGRLLAETLKEAECESPGSFDVDLGKDW